MKYKDFYEDILCESITDHTWKIGLAKKIYNDISRDIKSGMSDYKFTYKDHHVKVKYNNNKTKKYPPVIGIEYALDIYHPELKGCYLVFCPYMLSTRIDGKLEGLWNIHSGFKASVIKTNEGNLLLNLPVVRNLTVQFNGDEIEYPTKELVEENLRKDVLREWKPDVLPVIVHELVHLLDKSVKLDKVDFKVPYRNRKEEVKAYFIDGLSRFIKSGYIKYKNRPFEKFFNDFVSSKSYSTSYAELNRDNKKKITKWLYQIYLKKIKT